MSTPLVLLLLLSTTGLFTYTTLYPQKQKPIHLHFYFHEVFKGPNVTVVKVTDLNYTSTFGVINIFDNYLRTGIDPDSKLIGRIEGMSVHASLDGSKSLTAMNFVFTTGRYNGSSLASLGLLRGAPAISDRVLVGGTGKFKFSRGYALSKLIVQYATYRVIEFDLYVMLD